MLAEKRYYPFLDGLRAGAILWVVLYHTNMFLGSDYRPVGFLQTAFVKILGKGFLGVDIFFVISGFLITELLIDGFKRKESMGRFYTRRFFKIIPHYYVAVIVGIIVTALTAPRFLYGPRVILSYFFLYNNSVVHIPILSHMWFIAVIGHFYIVLPLIMLLINLIWKDPKRQGRVLLIMFVSLIVAGNMLRYHFCRLPIFTGYPPGYQMAFFRFDAFIFGGILKLLEPYLAKAGKFNGWGFSFILDVCSFLIFVYLIVWFKHGVWYHYTMAYVAAGALLVAGLKGECFLKTVMENGFSIWLGKNSYGIYLWHFIILYPFKRLEQYSDVPILAIIVSYLMTAIVLGALSMKTIERYFLELRGERA